MAYTLHLLQYLNTIKTLQFSIFGDNMLKEIICRAHKVLSRAHDITSFLKGENLHVLIIGFFPKSEN